MFFVLLVLAKWKTLVYLENSYIGISWLISGGFHFFPDNEIYDPMFYVNSFIPFVPLTTKESIVIEHR